MSDELHAVQVTIPGCCGQLEGRLLYREEMGHGTGVIICPPHPRLAGNMDNNVVQAVARAVAQTLPVVLFNYPAVGKSTSPQPGLPLFEVWNQFDQEKKYETIIDEVKRVVAWSGAYFRHYHLVGYSFGACMALAAISAPALSLTAIAPPLAEEDFSSLSMLPLPVFLITAEQDALLAKIHRPPSGDQITRTTIPGADHFFRNQEDLVAAQVATCLRSTKPE
jgi:alpha/beta superfamily hydrolase